MSTNKHTPSPESARRFASVALWFGMLIPLLALTSFAMHSFGPYEDCEARIDLVGGGIVFCADPPYVGECPIDSPCLDVIMWHDDIVMGIACSCGGTHFPGPYHCFAEVMVYWNMQYMRHFCTGPCPDAGDTCNDMGPRQDDSFCECYH